MIELSEEESEAISFLENKMKNGCMLNKVDWNIATILRLVKRLQ